MILEQAVTPLCKDLKSQLTFFFKYGVRINPVYCQRTLYSAPITLAIGEKVVNSQFQPLQWQYSPLAGASNPNHPITLHNLES